VPAITESARTSREGLFRELRTARALKGIVRKRLTYRMPHN